MSDGPARIVLATVTEDELDPAAIAAQVSDDKVGATVTFTGIVRNHDAGRHVTGIEYVGHPSAANEVAQVAAEFADRTGVHALAVVHRVGTLLVGDVALVVVVAASHRSQAFSTASDVVDRVKERLPVWKRQVFLDGTSEWTGMP